MNLDFLKKIPLFKNVDFEDPRSRRRVAGLFASLGIVLVTIVLMIADAGNGKKKPEKPDDVLGQGDDQHLYVPDGLDNDGVLAIDNMLTVRERNLPGNERIFREAAVQHVDDPLGFLGSGGDNSGAMSASDIFPEADGLPNPADTPPASREDRKRRASAVFGFGAAGDLVAQAQEGQVTPATAQQAENTAEDPAPKKSQPAATPQPSARKSSAPKAQQPRQPAPSATETAADVQQEQQGSTEVLVRRSGGISSLDDWGTVEGISSLDTESQYVVQDDDHPYRVMFTRTQKLRSGERISIRLLEDMAIDGILIPKNTHLPATVAVGERLEITVSNIEINGKIYSLDYIAFDNDGSQGLYCPQTVAGTNANRAAATAGSTAGTVINSAASIAGAAMGMGSLGSAVGNMANIGASAVTSRNGSVTATVNSGYMFYLLKNVH